MRRLVTLLAAAVAVMSCVREEPIVLVGSISLSPSELVIREGEQKTVSATISPGNATDKTLTWTSDAPEIATVADGKVTGVSKGKATITATANDASGVRVTCSVTVKYANPEISFDPGQSKTVAAGTEGGSFTLSFTALEDWTAAIINDRADSWLEISPTSGGKGKAEMTLTVAENGSFDGRSASVRITCDEESETITVTQKQKDAITLTNDRFEIGSEGGPVSVKLKSNVNFSYQIAEDCESWIQPVGTKSYDDYTLDFSVAANTGITKREGSILFTDGTLSETVKIFQEGAKPTIVISQDRYEIGSEGGEIRIDVGSNVDVTMVIPENATWLREVSTKAFSTNIFYLRVDPNPDPDDRSATVIFMNNENGLSEKVFITQKQLDQINIDGDEVTVGENGGGFDITLGTNVGYSVSIDSGWIKEISTKALVSHTHSFSVEPLPDDVSLRTATITFTDDKSQITRTFTVTQKDLSPIIQFKDEAVKAICVKKWDRDDDGELSEREAAAVKSLDWSFYQNKDIILFDELEFFTGLTEIHDSAFYSCEALKSVKIPENVTQLGNTAFYYCMSLESITLPEKLAVIGNWALGSLHSLKTLVIPPNVTTIGDYALYNCRSLKRVICLPEDPPECGEYLLRYCPEGWIIVPEGCVQKYKEAEKWKEFPERIITAKEEDSPVFSFNDADTKAYCVDRWDRNGDGELSEREAASVMELRSDNVMREITSFDELRYFTGLKSLPSYLFYGNENLKSVKLPPNLTEIGNYAFGYTGLQCELELPAGLLTIGESAFIGCKGLTGSLVIPEGVTVIPNYAFYNCAGLNGPLVLPEGLESIGELSFAFCSGLSGDLTIPSSITDVPVEAFYHCSGMKGTLTLQKDIKSIGVLAFAHTDFSRIDVLAVDEPVLGNDAFDAEGCLIYVPKGKATEYQEADGWKEFCMRITEEGHLPKDFFYSSTDYSRDGEVVCLQRATKGMGINIIFLGDGFVDRDMAPGGAYETLMRRWMEQFFAYEPYTTFREWFNIYMVKVVSKNKVFGTPDSERRLTRNLSDEEESSSFGNRIATLYDVCRQYAELVPNPTGQGLRTAVFMNTDGSVGRSFCSYSTSGYCTGFIFDSIDRRPSTLNHEIGGHGFAWLADEYTEFNEPAPNPRESVENSHGYGTCLNIDWRSDPSTVIWARYLQDPRYANEGLGVFEGASRYATGLFRASFNSMMRHDFSAGAVFNAPSREAIYRNIMRWGYDGDWEFDYETFVALDEAGRRQAAEAYAAYPPNAARPLSAEEDFKPGLPPLRIDDDVREIIVSDDGSVTIIR